MQYFQAVQQGKQRASKSQMKMFEAAGFGMLTLTTKKVDGKFQPVGEEEFTAVIDSPDGHVTIIVDKDGFTKEALISNGGYQARTKLTLDMAEKIKQIVFDDGAPES